MADLIPPGFRFYPTEEELISFYLHHKLEGTRPELNHVIPIVDIYSLEPWELPRVAGERCSGETEQWFFFMPQQEREARGGKPNRTTVSGYWKATGSPGYVVSSTHKRVIGVKKTMVFYKGRAPTGRKTKWKMNEYKSILGTPTSTPLENIPSSASPMPKLRHEMSLCRVYITSGSSRAFDRRPSTLTIRHPIPDAPGGPAVPSAPTPARASDVNFVGAAQEKSSSTSDSSSYGGEDRVVVDARQMDDAGSSDINVMNHEIIYGLEPFWEWEQLNWP